MAPVIFYESVSLTSTIMIFPYCYYSWSFATFRVNSLEWCNLREKHFENTHFIMCSVLRILTPLGADVSVSTSSVYQLELGINEIRVKKMPNEFSI